MVSIIIINYKQKTLTTQCVKSIFGKITSYPFEVIIVNNSKEDDLSNLKDEFNVRVFENENKGFSQASNLGVKYANGSYLFFLNSDTIIQNDFLGDTIKSFQDKNFGAVGFKLYNEDNTFQISFGYNISIRNEIKNKKLESLNWERDSEELSKIETTFSEIKQVDWVSGAAMLVKKEVFEKVCGFDERFFLYMEDSDICKRLSERGYEIFCYPFSKIVHLKGERVKKDFEEQSCYHAKESQLLYYKIHKGVFENVVLRLYLISKFFILSIFTFKKVNFRILILIAKNFLRLNTATKECKK
ncbi:MAG: glycosyltransferase family 2 protein [Ignavibacteria bacterium]|nr:glycosyltransferase family 2 protein [Ignavibacteria bacterium]